ncbi:DUF2514 domain-containing protein [Pantoea sp. B623]|uniref:DUF2514 domain-containing protein n=1 Tax=Pantoea TaxID=53335 RepID=UPI0021616CA2|nr:MULTISPECIES: DUF2514 domain-containing protein [Pantoea]MCS4493561.1 DUF2514 domain-containing protein [Pantoea sp. B623]
MVLVLVAGVMWKVYNAGYSTADAKWQQQWLQRDLADITSSFQLEIKERAREQRYQRAVEQERERANEELAKIKRDRDAAGRAAVGLRKQLKAIQRQFADSETSRLTAFATGSASTAEVTILLAELLSEADGLAGKFAEEADKNFAAGTSCERNFNKVKL